MRFGNIFTSDCVAVAQPPDARCSDPAFALANPGLCPTPVGLVIKPAFALTCALGSVQFRAFEVRNGVETDVTGDAIFSSSNLDVAMVGALSGSATGIADGSATITATYDGSSAHADLSVLAGDNCCAEQSVAMLLLMDTSKSMSQLFSANYASRLSYGLVAAQGLIGDTDATKDLIGLQMFNAAESVLLSVPTSDTEAVADLLGSVAQTQQITAFYDAFTDAFATLAATTADRKVLILISDGEDLTESYDDTNNPLNLASDFRAQGGIIVCLGTRASGKGYRFLSQIATGGFFINGYADTEEVSLDYLSGLKGYLCAGNCAPEGDEYEYRGELNYIGFANWDVVSGAVDLQGNGFFDWIPGNGLYVDLVSGMQDPALSNLGRIESKVPFTLAANHVYRLTLELAGNQLVDDTPYTARVRVYYLNNDPDLTPVYLLSQTITVDDYTQDFHQYAFSFTALGVHDVYISVEQLSIPADADLRVGLLLGSVKFENVTTATVLLNDNFDTENATYVPPKCGSGTTFVWIPEVAEYGYLIGSNCYGGGCLDEPPPSQAEDPNPLSDIESGTTPPPPTTTYTSTKTRTAECPEGTTNPNTTNLVPAMTSATLPSGVVTANPATVAVAGDLYNIYATELRAYWAFDGLKDSIGYAWGSDYYGTTGAYLQYQFPTAKTVDAYEITAELGWRAPRGWTFAGSNDGITWTTIDTRAGINIWYGQETKRFEFTNSTAYTSYRLTVTEGINYPGYPPSTEIYFRLLELALFGSEEDGATGGTASATETRTSTISQADADLKANNAAYAAALALLDCKTLYTSTKSYTAKCPLGSFGADVTASGTGESYNSQDEADAIAQTNAEEAANDLLNCAGSNNDQKVTIPLGEYIVGAQSSPYGTVKNVSGLTGVVTKIGVIINGLTHTYPQGLILLLRTPTGKIVELMRACGGDQTHPIVDVDLIFHDDASASLPYAATIVSGYYCPTQYGFGIDAPSPLEAGPYLPNLAAALSESSVGPNGSWSLWVYNRATQGSGSFDSWDLSLTVEAEKPYLIYGVGDSMITGDATLVEDMLALVPAEANGFVFSGDIMGTPGVPDPTEDWDNFYNFGFDDILDKVLYSVGNHDWLGESAAEQAATRSFWDGSFAAVYGGSFPASVFVTDPVDFRYTKKFGTWKFIVFNAAETDSEALTFESGGTAYEWIATELAEVGFKCILVGHKPRWSSGAIHGDEPIFASLWSLAVANGAIAWISGHDHICSVQEPRDGAGAVDTTGCVQLIQGGGSSNLYALNGAYDASKVVFAASVNGLLRLTLTPSLFCAAFIGTDGNVIDGSGVILDV